MKNQNRRFLCSLSFFIASFLFLQVSCKNKKQDGGGEVQIFEVELQNVEHRKIISQKDGASFAKFDKVPKGAKLHFILKAVDGWLSTLFSIREVNYREVGNDGSIEANAIITKNIKVRNVCSNNKKTFKPTFVVEPSEKGGKWCY